MGSNDNKIVTIDDLIADIARYRLAVITEKSEQADE